MVAFLKRRHFVPNPVQSNYCNRRPVKRRRPLFIHTGYDDSGELSTVTRYQNATADPAQLVATATYGYLCPGQVGGADFVRPLGEPGSKGVGRFSFSHKSMAA